MPLVYDKYDFYYTKNDKETVHTLLHMQNSIFKDDLPKKLKKDVSYSACITLGNDTPKEIRGIGPRNFYSNVCNFLCGQSDDISVIWEDKEIGDFLHKFAFDFRKEISELHEKISELEEQVKSLKLQGFNNEIIYLQEVIENLKEQLGPKEIVDIRKKIIHSRKNLTKQTENNS